MKARVSTKHGKHLKQRTNNNMRDLLNKLNEINDDIVQEKVGRLRYEPSPDEIELKKKAVKARIDIKTVRLLIALCREIPVDFIAANSYRSEKPPKTINEVTNIVRGSTRGISLGVKNHKNFKIITKSMSLPANSAMYNQMVCNTKINIKITKTLKNVLR